MVEYTKKDENLLYIIGGAVDGKSFTWADCAVVYSHFAACSRTEDEVKSKHETMTTVNQARMEEKTSTPEWVTVRRQVERVLREEAFDEETLSSKGHALRLLLAEVGEIESPITVPANPPRFADWELATYMHPLSADAMPTEHCSERLDNTLSPFKNTAILQALDTTNVLPIHQLNTFGDAGAINMQAPTTLGVHSTVTTCDSMVATGYGTATTCFNDTAMTSYDNTVTAGSDMGMNGFHDPAAGALTDGSLGAPVNAAMYPVYGSTETSMFANGLMDTSWDRRAFRPPTPNNPAAEPLAIVNSFAWNNTQAWIPPHEMYFILEEDSAADS